MVNLRKNTNKNILFIFTIFYQNLPPKKMGISEIQNEQKILPFLVKRCNREEFLFHLLWNYFAKSLIKLSDLFVTICSSSYYVSIW
ncbi:hypothetical protein BpHYR1_011859 [Brachionus plicatilis]|uniref:Uncharacterized protein n=1 Tax=Brachionus plicatilis TaxID=10195 RepID=A0A3M7RKC8_BRAPC|nr:hypothetical protein BpHYR1_011859 [Brachionus plicatilis]